MSKMIQIRDVPDALHRQLARRAAAAGMSLSDYLKQELRMIADKWTWDDVIEHLKTVEPVRLEENPVIALRRLRDAE